jgi:hypothetical protein
MSAAYALEVNMSTVKSLAIVALLVGGTSLAMAQNGPATGGQPPVAGGANGYPGYGYGYGYGAPLYDYAAPAYGYAAPAYGYAAPAYGYAAPAYGYAAPAYGYAAPAYAAPTVVIVTPAPAYTAPTVVSPPLYAYAPRYWGGYGWGGYGGWRTGYWWR